MSKSTSSTSSDASDWLNGRFKRNSSSRSSRSGSEVVHSQLLQDIDSECGFFEHTLTLEQLDDLFPLSRICLSDPRKSRGLNKDEAQNRLSKDGRNIICLFSSRATLKAFLAQFLNTFRLLLLIPAVICFFIYLLDTGHLLELYLAVTLLTIFLLLCAVSYWQERSAYIQMRGFQSIIPTSCVVIRCGERFRVNASEIVYGDLVHLSTGARVPADLRLIYAEGVRLETSWISGEMEAFEYVDVAVDKSVSALAAQNIAFNGCRCVSGYAIGVVIRTANNSVIGRLLEVTSHERGETTRLERDHAGFVRFISILAVTVGAATFLIVLVKNHFHRIAYAFVNGFLVLILANVPQGLPVTLGAALIIVARRLSKQRFFMKRLDVADTLGTATVVMCDKTGIFTCNDIAVTHLWHNLRYFKGVSRDLLTPSADIGVEKFESESNLSNLLTAMSLCNKAHITAIGSGDVARWNVLSTKVYPNDLTNGTIHSQNGISQEQLTQHSIAARSVRAAFEYKNVSGNASEVAIIKFVEELTSAQRIRDKYDVVYEIPFTGQRRCHETVVRRRDGQDSLDSTDTLVKYKIFVKGAPEELIRRCTRIATLDGEEKLNAQHVELFAEAYLKFGGAGCSCIAFAMGEFRALPDLELMIAADALPSNELCFLGMASLYDPSRDDIRAPLTTLRNAGVKCFMVTGDHAATAEAVALQTGLISPVDENDGEKNGEVDLHSAVINGANLDKFTAEQWDELLSRRSIVFARTTPAQKLVIVKECQNRSEVVAVTGDGVLDAPALKQADVGIAMEAVGSVFAKEAADMVLIKSDLKNIVKGIEEGRLLYENLKKTIAYTLTHLIPEVYAVLLTFTIGFPLGLSSLQVLTIDLITELPPSIALTSVGAERDLMRRRPRSSRSRLVSRGLLVYAYILAGNIIAVGCIFAYLSVFWYHGITTRELMFSSNTYWLPESSNFTSLSGKVFTPRMQLHVHGEATAAWHITLVMSQVFHVWMCTTRRVSLLRYNECNLILLLSVLVEVFFLNFFIYTPGVQSWLSVHHPPAFTWLFSIAVAVALLVFNETRKLLIRRFPSNGAVRLFKW